MGAIPVVPVFPAGTLVTSAALNQLCTAVTWCLSGKPLAVLTASSTQSIPNSTQTAVSWNSKIKDRDSGWSGSTPSRYTAQTPGIYKVAAWLPWAFNATGSRRLTFQVNTGSNNPAGSGLTTLFGTVSNGAAQTVTSVTPCKALTPYMYDGDYIQVMAWQDSGGALATTITSDLGPPVFTVELVSG